MKLFTLALAALIFVGCNKSSNSAAQNGPAGNEYGSSYIDESTGDTIILDGVFQDSTNAFWIFAREKAGTTDIIYSRSAGTYSANGSSFTFNYSYESCDPIHSQTMTIVWTSPTDAIEVTQGTTTVILKFTSKWDPQATSISSLSGFVLTEDTTSTCSQINP